jgi:hypothetical protein
LAGFAVLVVARLDALATAEGFVIVHPEQLNVFAVLRVCPVYVDLHDVPVADVREGAPHAQSRRGRQ